MFQEVHMGFADFQELRSPPGRTWAFHKVEVVNKSSSTVWFSRQESQLYDFAGVLLCRREELHLGPCVRISTTTNSSTYVDNMNLGPGFYNGAGDGSTEESARTTDTVRKKIS